MARVAGARVPEHSSGTSLIWRWQPQQAAGEVWTGWPLTLGRCLLLSAREMRRSEEERGMPAKSSAGGARVGGTWSFPQNTPWPKRWLPAQAAGIGVSLPVLIRSPVLTKGNDASRRTRNPRKGSCDCPLINPEQVFFETELRFPLCIALGKLINF